MRSADLLAAYSEEDVDALLTNELLLCTGKYFTHKAPHATLLAGQPGAGKTVLSSMLIGLLNGDAALINGDEFRRYHPNFKTLSEKYGSEAVKMTSAFSNAVVEKLIDRYSDHRINLVVEGTGRDASVPEATARLLVEKGYQVELAVIATRPEFSLASILLRFYKMKEAGTTPRATAIDAHDHVVEVLPANLDALSLSENFSSITIWDRDLNKLYDSCSDSGLPSYVLRSYWESPWSSEELRLVNKQVEELREKEQLYGFGQGFAIDELERRISDANQTVSFGMNMQ